MQTASYWKASVQDHHPFGQIGSTLLSCYHPGYLRRSCGLFGVSLNGYIISRQSNMVLGVWRILSAWSQEQAFLIQNIQFQKNACPAWEHRISSNEFSNLPRIQWSWHWPGISFLGCYCQIHAWHPSVKRTQVSNWSPRWDLHNYLLPP